MKTKIFQKNTIVAPVLNVLDAFTYPRKIDDFVQLFNPLYSRDKILARLVSKQRQTASCVTSFFKLNHNWSGIVPGQHVLIHVEIDGRRYMRPFSVSHVAADQIGLTIKNNADGFVSTWLNERATPNTRVEFSAPQGDFHLASTQTSERILYLAGGSGITPIFAQLEHLAAQGSRRQIDLIYFSRTQQETILYDELQALSARLERLNCHFVFTQETNHLSNKEVSEPYFSRQLLASLVPDAAARAVFVCGPQSLIASVDEWAAQSSPRQYCKEHFKPPEGDSVEFGAGGHRINLRGTGRALKCTARPLLEQLEDAGLEVDFGCRMGICQTCTCTKLSGAVINSITGETLGSDVKNIQLCISVPCSDVELEI